MNDVPDNPEQHIEASRDCQVRKVLMTPELMNQYATRTIDGYRVYWEWGEEEDGGFYTPYVRVDYEDKL
jgi:hypothetical protein